MKNESKNTMKLRKTQNCGTADRNAGPSTAPLLRKDFAQDDNSFLADSSAVFSPEWKIDAALRMLSEAQPPAAMTSRIHRNLNAAVATSKPVRSGRLIWIPAGCIAMATVLLMVFLQARSTRRIQSHPLETAKMMARNSASPQLATPLPALVPAESSRARNVSIRVAQPIFHARKRTRYRHAANLFNYPLTQQEKLLVRFVQTAKPADLQALNPEYQAKLEAQQEAEFAAYVQSGSSADESETPQTNPSTQE